MSNKNGIKKDFLIFALSITAVFVFPFLTSSKAYDVFVDADYEGSEDGSEDKPFDTIDEAVEEAMDKPKHSRNIFVKNGKYKEKSTLDDSVNLYGESKDGVIITDTVTMKNDTRIKNITIAGGYPAVLVEKNADVTIEDCDIKNFSGMGIQALPGDGKITIRNNDIYKGKTGKGIYIQEGRGVEISGNDVYDNGQEGIDIRAKVSGYISDNSITGNGESGIEFIVGSSKLEIKNNTIKSNGASGIASQFYKQSRKDGEISITGNAISKNKKYGLDCAIPSGGDPPAKYWSDSIELSGNTIEGNKIRPISNDCNIIQAVDEEEKADNTIVEVEAASADTEAEEEQKKKVAEAEEDAARRAEEAKTSKDKIIKAEIGALEQNRAAISAVLDDKIKKMEKRNGLIAFFVGPDFVAMDDIKNDLEKMKEIRSGLYEFAGKSESDDIKNSVQESVNGVSQSISEAETKISEQEGRFSLFGWLFRRVKNT